MNFSQDGVLSVNSNDLVEDKDGISLGNLWKHCQL